MATKSKSKVLQAALKKREAAKKAGTYVGSAELKSKLMKQGKSEALAGAIVGTIAREKYGKAGATALAQYGKKNKKK